MVCMWLETTSNENDWMSVWKCLFGSNQIMNQNMCDSVLLHKLKYKNRNLGEEQKQNGAQNQRVSLLFSRRKFGSARFGNGFGFGGFFSRSFSFESYHSFSQYSVTFQLCYILDHLSAAVHEIWSVQISNFSNTNTCLAHRTNEQANETWRIKLQSARIRDTFSITCSFLTLCSLSRSFPLSKSNVNCVKRKIQRKNPLKRRFYSPLKIISNVREFLDLLFSCNGVYVWAEEKMYERRRWWKEDSKFHRL